MRVLVTGACGMIGSAMVERFAALGWEVVGIDNNMRRDFFGPEADVTATPAKAPMTWLPIDVRNEIAVNDAFRGGKIDAIVHCAGQPSHDWAASDPLTDFDVNARGTLVLLEAARRHCPDAPFVFCSTNKVYGDKPNLVARKELDRRFEFVHTVDGIAEDFPIDRSMHSLFGCSKLAADLYVQEHGRYFGMPTCCLRLGCVTGAGHASVQAHGFLSFLTKCAVAGEPYTIFGYGGRQVRDNLWAGDVATFVERFVEAPRQGGAVYNLGGGRSNSVSIIEAVAMIEEITGNKLETIYKDEPRKGDHIVYYSDLRKAQDHYRGWAPTKDISMLLAEMIEDWRQRLSV